MTSSCPLVTIEVLIASTVGVEVVSTSALFNVTIERFLTPSLPKHAVNPDYAVIKEFNQLLKDNAASVDSALGRGNNGYLNIVLPPNKYAQTENTPFMSPTDPRITETVP